MTQKTTTQTVPVLQVVAQQPIVEKKAATPVDPFVQEILDVVNDTASNPNVQVTVSKVTKRFSAKTRDILYTIGIIAGAVGTFGTAIVASLTGDAALVVGTVASVSLTLQSTLAKFNLSKTADDIAAEVAA